MGLCTMGHTMGHITESQHMAFLDGICVYYLGIIVFLLCPALLNRLI